MGAPPVTLCNAVASAVRCDPVRSGAPWSSPRRSRLDRSVGRWYGPREGPAVNRRPAPSSASPPMAFMTGRLPAEEGRPASVIGPGIAVPEAPCVGGEPGVVWMSKGFRRCDERSADGSRLATRSRRHGPFAHGRSGSRRVESLVETPSWQRRRGHSRWHSAAVGASASPVRPMRRPAPWRRSCVFRAGRTALVVGRGVRSAAPDAVATALARSPDPSS